MVCKTSFLRSCLKKNHFYNNSNMNHAQCAAKLFEYADQCVAAYDAADPSHRSAAMKTALSECFHDFSCIKPNLQLGSREKVIFSLDSNPKVSGFGEAAAGLSWL